MRWAPRFCLLAVLSANAAGAAPVGTPSPSRSAATADSVTTAASAPAPATNAPALPTPTQFVASDNPGDSGGAILLKWTDPDSTALPAGSLLEVSRAEAPAFAMKPVAGVKPGKGQYKDKTTVDHKVYRYELRVKTPTATGPAVVSDPVSSHDNWFQKDRTNSLIATILFLIALLGSIQWAHSGKQIFIRRISGLNAVDEAIGRATETGRKVLYVPGIQSMDDIQTVASLSILGYIARATARYGTDLDVANKDPLTFASAREVVRGAYLAEGRPDLYREEMVNYVTYDQFAFTAAVSARMVRERPATIFLIGYFFAESLILAETGQSVGAIQIAGQADPTQLPFFVATCDYTLIGEELYAASAYLSREPVLLGSIRGQDIFKAIIILVGLTGIVLATFGSTWIAKILQTS